MARGWKIGMVGGAVAGGMVLVFLWAIRPVLKDPVMLGATRVFARDGTLLYEIPTPEGSGRVLITRPEIPPVLVQAVLAAEDQRFFSHQGVDVIALGRAAKDNLVARRVVGGGSTLEAQLVKIRFFPGAPRTLRQKIRELIAARWWAATHSKDQTLEFYLNSVYFGNHAYGIGDASRVYFQKNVGDLTVAESALLAGMISAPLAADPIRYPQTARRRQERVLEQMARTGVITEAQGQEAENQPLPRVVARKKIIAPYFVFRLLTALESKIPEISNGGYEIKTTLDPQLQTTVEETVRLRLHGLAKNNVTNAAVLVMDPRDGEVLAYLGGADYFDEKVGQINMAQTPRQPGSALKPFLYLTALMRGQTPATVLADLPWRWETADGESYYPRNYSHRYFGPVTMRDALGSSLNIPAVRTLKTVGMSSFFETMRRFGVTFAHDPDYYGWGIVLGGGEVTLEDLTAAYATLASGGRVRKIKMVQETPSKDQERLVGSFVFDDAKRTEQAAYLIADILVDPTARSRGFGETSLAQIGHHRLAVKTGTTEDFRDNWAFGYTPDIVVGVWVGNADQSPMQGITGLSGAVPILHDILTVWYRHRPAPVWPQPAGMVEREICTTSGLLANGLCPKTRRELFIAGSEPTKEDDWYVRCSGSLKVAPPQEFVAWFAAQGNELVVGRDCAEEAGLAIIAPFDQEVFEIDPQVSRPAQRIAFRAEGEQDQYRWRLNGQPIVSDSPTYLWEPQKGTYVLELEGADRQVRFRVE
ncbi:penicillin-binding protein 1C [Candidatus Uhrbacteria bacterium]|nr:penicillin-binding protein 1C [Candidatus Uhrbacteria bacterium]